MLTSAHREIFRISVDLFLALLFQVLHEHDIIIVNMTIEYTYDFNFEYLQYQVTVQS